MASEKISAMPSLSGNQVPTDLIPLVDLSALPANQNVKSTLNDLFAVVTKNITDRAVRFSAPGSTPALSAAGAGAVYFDGAKFQVSENTGAWVSLVVAGLISGSGLTQNTARILGRTTAGVGAVEEISIGPGLTLTGGVLDATGGGGGTPGGSQYDVQFHDSGGTFGGSNNFQFKPSGNPTVSIRATSASHNVLDLTADVAQTAVVLLIEQGGDNTASLLALRQGTLSTLNSSFPFRFENAAGTLILGLRSRPATGIYQFVSPGATNGQVVYEVNSLGSNNGLGTASVSGYPAIFAGNIQCLWFDSATGNTVVNQNYQMTWGSAPNSYDAGISRPTTNTLRVTNGSTLGGRLQVGGATGTGAALVLGSVVGSTDVSCLSATRNTTQFSAGTYTATGVTLNTTPGGNTTAVYIAGSNETRSSGSSNIGTLYGLQNIARHGGTGACTTVSGLICFGYLDSGSAANLYGADLLAQILSTGVATSGVGLRLQVLPGSGTIITGSGILISNVTAQTAQGLRLETISGNTAYGIFINSISGLTGPATTGYGVYINSISAATSYGVYVNGSYLNVSFGGSSSWSTVSDQRYKRDIVNYERGLETVLQLRPRRFTWNELSTCPGKHAVGLIAQEAQAVDYELVSEINADSPTGSMLTVDVANITHMLINSTKTLHERITALEEKIHA